MFKKFGKAILEILKQEYAFIIFLILFFFICNIPLNYYITVGGGISDASSRIKVDNAYQSKGSFNISYVTQLDANLLIYLISYLVPSWEREDANLYKYSTTENMDDIQFRSDLDLKVANGTATYWAYTLADKKIRLLSEKLYIIATFPEEYTTDLKIQDEILSIDENHFTSILEYRDYIESKEVGDTLLVKVNRKGKEQDIETKVYENNGKKLIGISLQFVREYETDPKLEIHFKDDESGPSGGLITALEIYNQLTKKNLTHGKIIAGTGTIEEDGTVDEIGGIKHKILGAVSAKADIFLTPGGENYEDAKAYIEEKKLDIQLIQIDSLEDAIQKLEALS